MSTYDLEELDDDQKFEEGDLVFTSLPIELKFVVQDITLKNEKSSVLLVAVIGKDKAYTVRWALDAAASEGAERSDTSTTRWVELNGEELTSKEYDRVLATIVFELLEDVGYKYGKSSSN